MINLIYAHPYPARSIAGRVLLDAARSVPQVKVRSLYDLYPDFSIDAAAERDALLEAKLIVWQHPMYWYNVPALLTLWFEKVLLHGWAFGDGGNALHGKQCLWVTTTGAPPDAFTPQGFHAHPFEAFTPPVKQTAQFCGMQWLQPIVVHGAHRVAHAELEQHAAAYRARLLEFVERHG